MPSASPVSVALRKNRALAHPHFESYRLASGAEAELQLAFDLPAEHAPRGSFDALPSLGAGKHHAHVLDRFISAHLAPGFPTEQGIAQAAYIDSGKNVVLIRIREGVGGDSDDQHQEVSFHPVFKLDSSNAEEHQTDVPEQTPSVVALDAQTWLVADGRGQVSTITVTDSQNQSPFEIKARSALVASSNSTGASSQTLPVKIAAAANNDRTRIITQTISRTEVAVSSHTFASPLLDGPAWTATTGEPLLFAQSTHTGALLIGTAPFSVSKPQPKDSNLVEMVAADFKPPTRAFAFHPFTWYQTSDALTLTFPLPAILAPPNFDITFKPHHVTIELVELPDALRITEIEQSAAAPGRDEDAAMPRSHPDRALQRITCGAFRASDGDAEGRKLWGDIDPSASFWTWERPSARTASTAANGASGLLTLHLEKRHHGTRWTHVFAPRTGPASRADTQDLVSSEPDPTRAKNEPTEDGHDDDDDDDDVPETLDPSERVGMLESLEKYTSELGSGESDARAAPHGSSLLEDGFEDEDAEVGRDAYLLSVPSSISSSGPSAPHAVGARTKLLGIPLPAAGAGSSSIQPGGPQVLVVKDNIDGLAFTQQHGDGDGAAWEHTSTLPALAYVLASKQDASHRVYAHAAAPPSSAGSPSGATPAVQVLAFEGSPPARLGAAGSSGRSGPVHSGGAGNLFVYYAPPPAASRVMHAESRVIRLGAGAGDARSSGSLIAVAKVIQRAQEGHDRALLLVLCQSQLLILPSILL